jgi:hypothetical protein
MRNHRFQLPFPRDEARDALLAAKILGGFWGPPDGANRVFPRRGNNYFSLPLEFLAARF